MKKVLMVLSFVFIASASFAGDWYHIDGKYSSVEYTKGYEATADSVLKIAELALPRLAKMVNLPLSEIEDAPARIILSDAMDISNGYSIENTVVIYTISSMYLPMWTGNIRWYEQVLTHELAHFITFKKIRRKGMKYFGESSNMGVPRWFYEGVAQYLSEKWNAFRGDISLKNALLSGRFSVKSMYNMQDGGLLYASGHAFTRYLVTEYGDSSLIKLMDYDKKNWVYSFDEAFNHVYKKSVEEMFPQFYRNLVIYYGDQLADYPLLELDENLPHFGRGVSQIVPLSIADSTYLVVKQVTPNQLYQTAVILEVKNKELHFKSFISDNFNTKMYVSPNKKYISYGRFNLGVKNDQESLNYRWYIYNRDAGFAVEIAQGIKAKYATFLNNHQLLLLSAADNKTNFLIYDLDKAKFELLYTAKMQVGTPEPMLDGGVIFSAQGDDGKRDLYRLNDNKLQRLINDSLDNRRPIQIDDTHVLFTRIAGNKPQLALLDLQTKSVKVLVDAQNDYWFHHYDREAKEVILASYDPLSRVKYTKVATDSLLKLSLSPRETYHDKRYSRWMHKEPDTGTVFTLPDTTLNRMPPEKVRFPQLSLINIMSGAIPLYTASDGWGVGVMTTWVEPLQRQLLSGMVALFGTGWDNSLVMLNSITRAYNALFSLNYYHGPVIFPYYENGELVAKQDIAYFSWAKPLNPFGNRRISFSPTVSYGYRNFKTKTNYTGVPSQFNYHGAAAGVSFDYNLPTTFYPALAKKSFNLTALYFNSFEPQYKFSISEVDMTLATDIFSERLGVMLTGSYLRQNGTFPAGNGVGIDSYYQLDMPRDFTYSRTVRGVNRNLYGTNLLWGSGEVIWYLTGNSNMALLFIPITNLTINGFYDYARIENGANNEVYSYGAQLSFGEGPVRFGGGYVESFFNGAKDDVQYYWRISLLIPKRIVF